MARTDLDRVVDARRQHRKKRHWIVVILLCFVIAGAILVTTVAVALYRAITSEVGELSERVGEAVSEFELQPSPAGQASPEPPPALMGQPVTDGSLEFVVRAFTCGRTTVGTGFMAVNANGHYCVLDLSVMNTGNTAVMFDEGEQHLFDGVGREYSYSLDATHAHNYDPNGAELTGLNPGQSIETAVVFDVPREAQIVSAQLSGVLFSDGVVVGLS